MTKGASLRLQRAKQKSAELNPLDDETNVGTTGEGDGDNADATVDEAEDAPIIESTSLARPKTLAIQAKATAITRMQLSIKPKRRIRFATFSPRYAHLTFLIAICILNTNLNLL